MRIVSGAREAMGYVFIAFGAVFVFWVSAAYCFSTQRWLLLGDSTYAYLLNGLNIATGHLVGHTDHPGTTLQILCAILLRIFYFFAPDSDGQSIVMSVLTHPDWYLRNIFLSIFALQSIILAAVASWAWRSFNTLAPAVVLLCGVFASPLIIMTQVWEVWPEILIPSLCFLLAAVTLKRWREHTLAPALCSPALALSAGAVTGLASFTKITCFPIFFMSFFLWKDKKNRLLYAAGFVGVALFCMLFFWDLLGKAGSWLINLALHTGHYGDGPASVVDMKVFYLDMMTMITSNMPLVVLLVLTLVGLFLFRKKRNSLGWKISALYTVATLLVAVIVAKQYRQRYLMPIYFPIFFVPLLCVSQMNKRSIQLAVYGVCAIFTFSSLYILYGNMMENKTDFSEQFPRYDTSVFQGKNIIEVFDSLTVSYGLSVGNDYARGRYSEILQQMYPHIFTYDMKEGQFYHFKRPVSLAEILSKGPTVIHGTQLAQEAAVVTARAQQHNQSIRLAMRTTILGDKLASFKRIPPFIEFGDAVYEVLGEIPQKGADHIK